jgi:hypothetical protein
MQPGLKYSITSELGDTRTRCFQPELYIIIFRGVNPQKNTMWVQCCYKKIQRHY